MGYHRCSICGEKKSTSDFYKKSNVTGTLARKVSSDCRTCRATAYQRKKGNEPSGICERCGSPAVLYSNGQCKRCLKQQGLKECSLCKHVLSVDLDFTKKRATCIPCSSAMACVRREMAKRQEAQAPRSQEASNEHDALPDQPDNSGASSHA